MISKTMRAILHTLSYGNIEVESSRRLVDIKKLDAMNIFLKKWISRFSTGTTKSLCGFIFLLKKP
ncbi:hypothetical protein [Ruminococcus sp. AM42-11]|uniref:hypothetical protein n=1 Tax=Ruminococcus sp. AM42-11 TaxID=2292372 RepID=UPI00267A5AED